MVFESICEMYLLVDIDLMNLSYLISKTSPEKINVQNSGDNNNNDDSNDRNNNVNNKTNTREFLKSRIKGISSDGTNVINGLI